MIRQKKHRLPSAAYFGQRTVSITACALDKKAFLNDREVVDAMVALLRESTEQFNCLVPIYCFMPDHLHLLIQGTEAHSKPKQAMDHFKGTSGQWLLRNLSNADWQEGYWDHVVRSSEDLRNQAFYIFRNPVRKGLVTNPYDYPFSGSIGYDLQQWFFDLCW